MSRFAPLPKRDNRTATTELINWGDPGDYRNRGAVTPRSSSKRLQAYYDSNDIPATPAQSAKAIAPATAKVSAAAPAAPTKPKSAATIAAEAFAERAAKVMKSPAAIGKVKAAAELLGNTSLTPAEIVAQLATAETDAARQQAEISDTWAKAVASANARNGFPTNAEQPAPQKPVATESETVWTQAIAKVNQINDFTGEAA